MFSFRCDFELDDEEELDDVDAPQSSFDVGSTLPNALGVKRFRLCLELPEVLLPLLKGFAEELLVKLARLT